jgi:hypothetical protein
MKTRILVAAIILIFLSGCTSGNGGTENNGQLIKEAIVFKSPTCGCCGNYIEYMEEQGYKVKKVNVQDLTEIKERYNIPQDMQSCHTTLIGDYFVEGHVPIESVEKLLTEKPDVDGIALPAMPSGSPGMPGEQTGEFTVYSITDGKASAFDVQ